MPRTDDFFNDSLISSKIRFSLFSNGSFVEGLVSGSRLKRGANIIYDV